MGNRPQQPSSLSPERRKLFSLLLKQAGVDIAQQQAIPRRGAVETLPLSFAQQRLWFFDQLEPGSSAYNMSIAVRLSGQLDSAALQRSIDAIIRRHESLRTTFPHRDGQPAQVIAPHLPLTLTMIDLRDLPPAERAAAAERLANHDAQQPFDLAHGPLLRTTLLRLGQTEHLFLLTIHHIVADGWSLGIFVRELAALYSAFSAGQPDPLPELPIQYADFALWQRAWLQGEGDHAESPLQLQLDYWRHALAGAPPLLELPLDHPRPAVQSYRGTRRSVVLPAGLTEALNTLGRQAGATLFMVLLAALQTLFYCYSGQTDIVVSSGIANRTRRELEPLIGCLINILLLRGDLSGDPRFGELLGQVRRVVLEAQAHQDLPFEKLVEELQPQRDPSYTPLAQVMLVLHNAPMESLEVPGLRMRPVTTERAAAQYDLLLHLVEGPGELTGALEYNTTVFESTTIARLLRHFEVLLGGIVADPACRLADLPLLTAAERQQALIEWNDSQATYPLDRCLHALFEDQAPRRPDAVALVFDTSPSDSRTKGEGRRTKDDDTRSSFVVRRSSIVHLTYAELDRRANRLAHFLRARGVGPNRLVGICMERSAELVIALLGVLKAGGAYVPLDPAYPPTRLAFMIEDSQAAVLITATQPDKETSRQADKEHLNLLVSPSPALLVSRTVVDLRADWNAIARQPATPPSSGVTADDLVYMIYTSGSTGQPKGVLLDHRGRVNNFYDYNQRFAVGSDDRLLALSSLSFDMSAYDILGTLASGAAVLLPTAGGERDPTQWAVLLHQQRATIWHSAPALLELLLAHLALHPALPPRWLRLALLGGDWIPLTQPERLRALAPDVQVISLGGATELSMDSTIYPVGARDPSWKSIPYGRPLANQLAYVLDARLRPAPIGIAGELYLGGAGVAWGYLGRPDLTAERFIPNPFSDCRLQIADCRLAQSTICNLQSAIGMRLYKTGDLARYRADGTLELLGRSDHQIKLRGLRIEPGEIESALRDHPAVRASAVLMRTDAPGEARLVAYVVPTESTTDDGRLTMDDGISSGLSSIVHRPSSIVSELRAFLKERLPDYMIPSAFVALDALPLTPNGKLDRRALPTPEQAALASALSFVAPRTSVEARLAQVWAAVLGQEMVGIDDNFFSLGGDSFKAIRMVQQHGADLALIDLFTHPTIRELAAYLAQPQAAAPALVRALRQPASAPALTLVCVPYAGGSAVVYQPLAAALPPDYALYAVDLPGHDFTRQDEPLESIAELAPRCATEVQAQVRGPLALYGHCGGVALTLAIARLLEQAGVELAAVCLAGALPVARRSRVRAFFPRLAAWRHGDAEAQLRAYIKSLGGFDEVVDPAELGFVMRTFRHDGDGAFAYFQSVYAEQAERKLRAPILCIVGEHDPLTRGYARRFAEWRMFGDAVALAVVPGGKHYFVKHQAAHVAQIIVDLLTRINV